MKWLWIGDSLTDGMRPGLRAESATRGIGGSISAAVGWSTARWLREGDPAGLVRRAGPDVVIAVLGTNDEAFDEAATRALVAAAGGRRVLWIGPFHTTARDADYRRVLGGANFIAGAPLAVGLTRSQDGLHFTVEGYKVLANRCVTAVLARLRRSRWYVVAGGALAGVVGIGAVRLLAPARTRATWERRR
jgi:lysophospholipase L1-like esterase